MDRARRGGRGDRGMARGRGLCGRRLVTFAVVNPRLFRRQQRGCGPIVCIDICGTFERFDRRGGLCGRYTRAPNAFTESVRGQLGGVAVGGRATGCR